MDDRTGLGPQHRSDGPFAARMRLHQSWWRSQVLGLPYGTGPRAGDTAHYGNMLPAELGTQGHNFLTDEILAVYQNRKGSGVEAVPLREQPAVQPADVL